MKIESKVCTMNREPSSAPSSRKGRMKGSVMWRKLATAPAPSTRAASRVSRFCDCSPARTISIMNGVQRQTSMVTMVAIGNWLTQSTWPSPIGERT